MPDPRSRGLRRRSAHHLTRQPVEEQRESSAYGNGLVSDVLARMTARRAFSFVLRAHPEIAKKSGSEYSRNQRRAHRALQSKTVEDGPAPGEEVSAP